MPVRGIFLPDEESDAVENTTLAMGILIEYTVIL
jgi:hypothetical protein